MTTHSYFDWRHNDSGQKIYKKYKNLEKLNFIKNDSTKPNNPYFKVPDICKIPKLYTSLVETTTDKILAAKFNMSDMKFSQICHLADKGIVDLSLPVENIKSEFMKTVNSHENDPFNIHLYTETLPVEIKNFEEANSVSLGVFCTDPRMSHCLIKNLLPALKIDLNWKLFSIESILQKEPDLEVDVTLHTKQPESIVNWDKMMTKQSWYLEQYRTKISLKHFASYKEKMFKQDQMLQINKRRLKAIKLLHRAEGDFNDLNLDETTSVPLKDVRFVDAINLSKLKNFDLKGFDKLPEFLRPYSNNNILSHIDEQGKLNPIQLQIKVPHCRTRGTQENLGFAKVDINIGTGSVEWFIIDPQYFPILKSACTENKVDIFRDNWWPPLDDLWEYKIPVSRIVQNAGDVVYLNAGTIHWSNSQDWNTSISWHVPILTKFHYCSIMNIADIYRSLCLPSGYCIDVFHFRIVFFIEAINWLLAKNVKFENKQLFLMIKSYLAKRLYYWKEIRKNIESLGIEILPQNDETFLINNYCSECNCELFNFVFIKILYGHGYNGEDYYCYDCSLVYGPSINKSNNLVALEHHSFEDLEKIYNSLTLND